MQYKLVVGGGTFDNFHSGHKAFLRSMLEIGDQLLLGITSDAYVIKSKSPTYPIQAYELRKQSVQAFFEQQQALARVKIEPIDSVLYPQQWAKLPIEAIIVTQDTLAGAKQLNDTRRGLPPLEIVVVPTITNRLGQRISSTNIRSGSTNPEGVPYFPEPLRQKDLILPLDQRHVFKQPFGRLYTTLGELPPLDLNRLVTVGDVVTKRCNTVGLRPKLSVFDYNVQRRVVHKTTKDLGFDGSELRLQADNPAAHIHPSLVAAIVRTLPLLAQAKQVVIQLQGEEDLAVIPLLLLLPLGYVILYGQPGAGVVYLQVTPETKAKARQLLQKFVPA